MIRRIVRRAALRVPAIRRLLDTAIAATNRAHDEAQRANEQTKRVEVLLNETSSLREQRDVLEAQLYVLRSDHQRTIGRADMYRRELSELRAKLGRTEELLRASEEAGKQPTIAPADIDLLYAKLAGRLTHGFAQIESELLKKRLEKTMTGEAAQQIALYLDLLEKALTGQLVKDAPISPWSDGFDMETRLVGRDWPSQAHTMIGAARMRNLRLLTERVLGDDIQGDLIEAGVWRGGACIYMRGILAAHGVRDRTVWVADSFAGLPPPDPANYPADANDPHHTFPELSVPLEEVRANFATYGLLDEQVRFLKGWFADTLHCAPIEKLAILRLDGDMYSSTIQTLDALYPKVSNGGYVIIDDYILPGCRKAVDAFRERHGLTDAIEDIDGAGAFWRKSSPSLPG